MLTLNLLVLQCADIVASRRFYELFGMTFTKHAHGQGPEHYAYEDERGVFELYPARRESLDQTGLGFTVSDLEWIRDRFCDAQFEPKEIQKTEWGTSFVVRDPDGRRVEVTKK